MNKVCILLVLLVVGLCSCEKSLVTNVNGDEVAVEEGGGCLKYPILEFETEESWIEFMNEFKKLSVSEMQEHELLKSFFSQKRYYDDLENRPDSEVCEVDQSLEIADPYLSSVISRDGEISIAGKVYWLRNDYVFGYENCQQKEQVFVFMEAVKQGKIQLKPGETMVFNLGLFVYAVAHEWVPRMETRESYNNANEFQNRRKVYGEMWDSNFFIYASMGTKTVMKKKRCGAWIKTKADLVVLDWNVRFYINSPLNVPNPLSLCSFSSNIFSNGSMSEEDTKSVTQRFDWTVGIGINLNGGNISGLNGVNNQGRLQFLPHRSDQVCRSIHSVVYKGNGPYSCDTYWNSCN